MSQQVVKWFQFETNIVLNIEGRSYVVSKSDARYDRILEAIRSGDDEKLKGLVAQDSINRMKKLIGF